MRFISFFAFATILATSQVNAQEDPKACAAIAQDAKRLECFDLIFKKSSVTTPLAKTEWIITEEKSKIDDTTNVTLSLKSIEQIQARFGGRAHIELFVLCREKKTDFYIIFGGQFMSSTGSYGTVTFRTDKQPAVQKRLTESTDHKALGLWGGANSIPFIKSLFGGSLLFVRATPFSESSISGEFNISGLQDAIVPLRKACAWTT